MFASRCTRPVMCWVGAVRVEHQGEGWVVSGDYKLAPDPTCRPFEVVECDVFITEATFGLPIYRWPAPAAVFEEIHQWWRANQQEQRTSVLYAYTLGKSQRLLAGLDPTVGPIFVHGTMLSYVEDIGRPAWNCRRCSMRWRPR